MKKRIRLIILCLIMMITCVVTPYEGIYAAGTVPVKSMAGMTDLDTLEWEPVELTGEEKYDSYLYMDEELYEGSLDLILDEDDDGLLGASDQTTADTGLYKTQLSGMKLKIYEGFENAGANVTASTGVQIVIPYSTDSERAQYWSQANSEYYAACLAFARDNIELMLNNESNGASIGGGWNGSTLTITIKFTQSKYYSSALQAQVDSKIEEVVAGAPSGRYDAIKYYHDWLVNTNEYDNVALGASPDTERFYRAHSQVGCLIDGTGVCESYAKSFKIFCKKSGIPCVIVTGYANGDHAWNLVKMEDDQWYLVDCTWDDPTSNNGPVLRYIYFLVTQPDSHINDSRFVYPQTASADYVNKGATTTPTPAPTSAVTPTPAPTSAVTPTPTSTPTPASNKCGDKMTWNISNSTLTISGEGDMYDYEEYAPWHDYKDKFDKVSVDKWVEKLGKNSFYDCTNIKTLTINGSDTEIKNVESLMYKDDAGQLKWIDDITVMIPTKSKSETWALNNKAPGFMFHGAVTDKSSLIQINDDVGFRCVLIYEAPGVTLGQAYKMIVSLDGETIAVYDDMYQNAIEDNWFYFPAKVSLKDMSKDITFTFLSGANDETPGIRMCEDLVVSADDFIKNQIDYEIEEYKEEDEVWWYAIASGLAAETYFGTRSEKSAYELLESYAGKSKAYDVTQKINEVNVQTLMNSSKKVSGTQKGVTYLGTSLDLLNSTTIKHYFRIDSEVVKDLCPKINNKNISFQKVDGDIYTLEINKILPTQYSDIFETCVGDLKIIYSVDSYFYDVLSKGKNNELNKLVKFLYLYGKSSASCWKE